MLCDLFEVKMTISFCLKEKNENKNHHFSYFGSSEP